MTTAQAKYEADLVELTKLVSKLANYDQDKAARSLILAMATNAGECGVLEDDCKKAFDWFAEIMTDLTMIRGVLNGDVEVFFAGGEEPTLRLTDKGKAKAKGGS